MRDPKPEPASDPAKEYPPYAVGLDPVTNASETTAQLAEILAPGEPIRRDPYFGNPITGGQPAHRRSDFSATTWVMIVIAGVVLGAAVALMAAGA
jgi:hypothetical protein